MFFAMGNLTSNSVSDTKLKEMKCSESHVVDTDIVIANKERTKRSSSSSSKPSRRRSSRYDKVISSPKSCTSESKKNNTILHNNDDTRKETEFSSCSDQQYIYATSSMKGLRPRMEDAHLICTTIPVMGYKEPLHNHSIFGVFDGHGGNFTSNYISQNFIDILSQREELIAYMALPSSLAGGENKSSNNNPQSNVDGIKLLKTAIYKTFIQLDDTLLSKQRGKNTNLISEKMEQRFPSKSNHDNNDVDLNEKKNESQIRTIAHSLLSSMERSGSTAVIVLITPTHIICANSGDSRAILRRYNSTVIPLSFDHKPTGIMERLRIENAGGYIQKKRIDGDLAVSRSFGDFIHKQNTKLSKNKQKMIVSPEFTIISRNNQNNINNHNNARNNITSNNNNNDEFIVLACDGIWDVMSNEECSDIIHKLISSETALSIVTDNFLGNICEEICNICYKRNSRDNMTIMIIAFTNNSIVTSSSLSANNVGTKYIHNYFIPNTNHLSSFMSCHNNHNTTINNTSIINCSRLADDEVEEEECKNGTENVPFNYSPQQQKTNNSTITTQKTKNELSSNTNTPTYSPFSWLVPLYYNNKTASFSDSQRIVNWF